MRWSTNLPTSGVGNLFHTVDQFQPGYIFQTGPQQSNAHAHLLQLVSHHDTDSVRGLGLHKMLRPAGIMVVIGTGNVFLMSVVPVTFGPIWSWFCPARNDFSMDWHRAAVRCLPTADVRNVCYQRRGTINFRTHKSTSKLRRCKLKVNKAFCFTQISFSDPQSFDALLLSFRFCTSVDDSKNKPSEILLLQEKWTILYRSIVLFFCTLSENFKASEFENLFNWVFKQRLN